MAPRSQEAQEAQEAPTKYIISIEKDYADEFDYPIISIFSSTQRTTMLLHSNFMEDIDFDEMYFGTNEYLNFTKNEIMDMIQNAKKITPEEVSTLYKYNIIGIGLDIIDNTIDRMVNRIRKLHDPAFDDLIKKLED